MPIEKFVETYNDKFIDELRQEINDSQLSALFDICLHSIILLILR